MNAGQYNIGRGVAVALWSLATIGVAVADTHYVDVNNPSPSAQLVNFVSL